MQDQRILFEAPKPALTRVEAADALDVSPATLDRLERYSDLDSAESHRRQSRLDFFLAEAEWMGCDSTLQAMSYAMELVEEVERRERQVSDDG